MKRVGGYPVKGASEIIEKKKKDAANNVKEDNFLVNSNLGHLKSDTGKETEAIRSNKKDTI